MITINVAQESTLCKQCEVRMMSDRGPTDECSHCSRVVGIIPRFPDPSEDVTWARERVFHWWSRGIAEKCFTKGPHLSAHSSPLQLPTFHPAHCHSIPTPTICACFLDKHTTSTIAGEAHLWTYPTHRPRQCDSIAIEQTQATPRTSPISPNKETSPRQSDPAPSQVTGF